MSLTRATSPSAARKRRTQGARGCVGPPLALLFLLLEANVAADDWPRFRGPRSDGISHETDLLESWTQGGPAELWRIPLGSGFSGATVVDDRLYTLESRGESEYVLGLDIADGREIWRSAIGTIFREPSYGDGPRSMPTVEGGILWALGASGTLAAFRTADGELLWSVDLPKQLGAQATPFGFATMPLVVARHVVVEVPGTGGTSVFAFDKRSGELAWRANAGESSYSSPIYVTWAGIQQLLFFNRDHLVSLAPDDGKLLWQMPFPEHPIKIAQPVFVPPDMVFVSASYDLGSMVVRLKSDASKIGGVTAEKLWQSRVIRSHFSTSVAYGGLIYGFDNATLKCVTAATGEQRWAERNAFGKGSLILADGNLIVLTEQGRLVLVEATGQGYREKGVAKILSGRTWTPPSLADGRLYVRSRTELVALDLRHERPTSVPEPLVAATHGPDTARRPAGPSANSPATEVDAVVDGYLRARGDALARINTVRLSGRYLYDGDEYPFTIYRKRPDLYRFETQRPDNGEQVVVACDGTTGWRRLDDLPRSLLEMIYKEPIAVMSADKLERIREEEADFEGPLVNWREKGHQVELVGTKTLENGVPTYHLRVTLKSGHVQHWYLDQQRFTLVKKTTSQVMDDVPVGRPPHDRHSYFLEYRRVEGVLLPVRYEEEDYQLVRTFEVDHVELNAELDDDLFAMPEEAVENGREARLDEASSGLE